MKGSYRTTKSIKKEQLFYIWCVSFTESAQITYEIKNGEAQNIRLRMRFNDTRWLTKSQLRYILKSKNVLAKKNMGTYYIIPDNGQNIPGWRRYKTTEF